MNPISCLTRILSLAIASLSFFLFTSFSTLSFSEEPDSPENSVIKGVFGLPIASPVFKDKSYDEIAVYLKNLGINTVVGVPLKKELIEVLHLNGIRVYAATGIFAGEEHWIRAQGLRPINSNGEPIAKQDWYAGLCPTQEWFRKEKLYAIKRIVEDFDVDGVWLDFIRYPCHWEVISPVFEETCFCDACIEKFKKDYQVIFPENLADKKAIAEFILNLHSQEWYAFRCGQITSFVRDAKNLLAEKNPGLELGIFSVPWRGTDFDNAITNVIAQDFKDLASYVDIFSPMVYHKMCGKDKSWIGEIIRYMQGITNKKVIPILQAKDVPGEELIETIKEALAINKSGVIVFDMETVIREEKEETLTSAFGDKKL